MSENVRTTTSKGAQCAGWCNQQIPPGAKSLSVKFDVPVLFSRVTVEQEICVPCGKRLRGDLDREIRKAEGR